MYNNTCSIAHVSSLNNIFQSTLGGCTLKYADSDYLEVIAQFLGIRDPELLGRATALGLEG